MSKKGGKGMTKQDAIWLAIERKKNDNKKHTVYNAHTIEGYFVDSWKQNYTVERVF